MGIESLKNRAETRINFVKFLVMKYSDLDQEIDPDADWDEFVRKHPALVTL